MCTTSLNSKNSAFTFLIINITRCTNFLNLFLELKSICFEQFLCPSSGIFHCTHNNSICHTVLPAVSNPLWHITLLCLQWKTPDDGQMNYPKHVEFRSKNKFEELEYTVGFIIRNISRCTVTWTSKSAFTLTFYLRVLYGPHHVIRSFPHSTLTNCPF